MKTTSQPLKITALARSLGVTNVFINRFMIAKGFRLQDSSTPEVAVEWLRARLV